MFQEMKPPLYHLPQNIHEPGSAAAIKQEEDDAKFKVRDIVVDSKVTSGYLLCCPTHSFRRFKSLFLISSEKLTSQQYPPNFILSNQVYECK